MVGGRGADVFVFSALGDSRPKRSDRLEAGDRAAAFDNPGSGFGDRIDVSAIDADPTRGGDQAFRFGLSKALGWLWLKEVGGATHVRANADERPGWDFELVIADGGVRAAAYTAADFLL